ncbi:hypothetical protein [Cytobacillus sp. IB215665]|uniref:hypothetical protein n=1 Tax=Cytobacillus sp. IB215665 TaxID=3097357 RepID=UPI002A0C67FE|nr:hypothetical protein [Cytobacillus sp. IB215665]MDX8367198.1 hypothetical protein [Cytobacillus sp. IB215665]
MKQTPEIFVAQKIVYAMLMAICFTTLFVINQNFVMLGIAVVSSIVMYFYPNYTLSKNIQYAKAMRKIELPDYLTPLAKLMSSYTPYQAVKECEKFAGPYLKPYVDKLMVDMDLDPGSIKPFQTFASQIGVPQADLFVVAIQQALTTDRIRSKQILEKQRIIMMKIREESYNELINIKPIVVNKYNMIVVFNMILVVLSMVVYVFLDFFSAFG